jgi:hypothetical protein
MLGLERVRKDHPSTTYQAETFAHHRQSGMEPLIALNKHRRAGYMQAPSLHLTGPGKCQPSP